MPGTPLQTSPQEAIPVGEEQGSSQTTQSDGEYRFWQWHMSKDVFDVYNRMTCVAAEIPSITVSAADEDEPPAEGSSEEAIPPAGTSSEGTSQAVRGGDDSEGFDGVRILFKKRSK